MSTRRTSLFGTCPLSYPTIQPVEPKLYPSLSALRIICIDLCQAMQDFQQDLNVESSQQKGKSGATLRF